MKRGFSLKLAVVMMLAFCGLQAQARSYGYTWKTCERADMGQAAWPFDDQKNVIENCAPDTLYTWTNAGQADAFIWHAQNDTPGQLYLKHQMFFFRTPSGTYGYGERQVRIKLRPDVKFVVQDANYGRTCPVGDTSNTVYVSYLDWLHGWVEYIICSTGPVESFSEDTPEGYQELRAEQSWVTKHQPGEYDVIDHDTTAYGNADNFLHENIPDPHTDWTQAAFDANMTHIQTALQANPQGYVFFAPGVNSDRASHFTTKFPNYFNPNSSN